MRRTKTDDMGGLGGLSAGAKKILLSRKEMLGSNFVASLSEGKRRNSTNSPAVNLMDMRLLKSDSAPGLSPKASGTLSPSGIYLSAGSYASHGSSASTGSERSGGLQSCPPARTYASTGSERSGGLQSCPPASSTSTPLSQPE